MEIDRLVTVFDSDLTRLDAGYQTATARQRRYVQEAARGFQPVERAARDTFRQVGRSAGDGFGEAERAAARHVPTINRLLGSIGGVAKSALSTGIGVLTGNLLTSAITRGFGALKGEIEGGFDFLDVTRRGEQAFTKMFQSAGLSAEEASEKAKAHVKELIEYGSRTGTGERPIQLSQQLQAVGFAADEVLPSLRAIYDAVSLYPDAGDRLQRVILQLGQLKTTGQVSGEELRTLAENGVNAWKYLSEYSGKSIAELRKSAQAGMLDADVAVKVIIAGMGKEFEGMAEVAANSYSGMWDRIGALRKQRAGEVFAPAFDEVMKGQRAAISGLESEAAKGFAQNAAAIQTQLIGGFDKVLGALATGDLKSLGEQAVGSVTSGVSGAATGLYGAAVDAAGQLEKGVRDRLQMRSPSVVMLGLGFDAGTSFIAGFLQATSSQRKRLEEAAENDVVKAFFEAIRKAEGGQPNIMAGGRRVNSGARHPGEVVPRSQWFRGPEGPSSAAGNFQITRTNWRDIAPKLGLTDFSDERQQMLAALKLFDDAGGLFKLLAGDIQGAVRAAGKHWAGVPGSPLPGREASSASFMRWFQQGAQGFSAQNPVPVRIVAADTSAKGGGWGGAPSISALEDESKAKLAEMRGHLEVLSLAGHDMGRAVVALNEKIRRAEAEAKAPGLAFDERLGRIENVKALTQRRDEFQARLQANADEFERYHLEMTRQLNAIQASITAARSQIAESAPGFSNEPYVVSEAAQDTYLPMRSFDVTKALSLIRLEAPGATAALMDVSQASFQLRKAIAGVGPEIEAGFKRGTAAAEEHFGSLTKLTKRELALTWSNTGDVFEDSFNDAFDDLLSGQIHSAGEFGREWGLAFLSGLASQASADFSATLREMIFGPRQKEAAGTRGQTGGLIGDLVKAIGRLTGLSRPDVPTLLSTVPPPAAPPDFNIDYDEVTRPSVEATRRAADRVVGAIGTHAAALSMTVAQSATQTLNAIKEQTQMMIALQPQPPTLLQTILGAAISSFGSAFGAGLSNRIAGGENDEGPTGPRPTTPPVLKRESGGPAPAWTPMILAERGTEAVMFDRPGHVFNAGETSRLFGGGGKSGDTYNNTYYIQAPAPGPRSHVQKRSSRDFAEMMVGFLKSRT